MIANISKKFVLMLVVILCLILAGGFMLTKSLNTYRAYNIKTQDEALDNIVNSVDSTLTELCQRYLSELRYVTGRKGFQTAQETWMSSGVAQDLLFRLRENLLGQDEAFETMIAVVKNKVILSTNGKMDYWLPERQGEGLDVVVCSDEELHPFLAFVEYKEGITYAAIMDPLVFYEKVEMSSGLKAMGDMILMDEDHSMFLYRDEEHVVADLLADEGEMENPLLQILLYAHMKEKESIDFYQVKEGPYKEAYQARVAVCPESLSENSYFTIGILHNEEKQNAMMRSTALEILFYGGMVLLGIVIMLFYLLWIYRQDARNRKEIEILKQKKAAVEELNAKTMELAHHQRLETIGQLTSGVAHEFNNLLTPIMGYSLMTMENLPEQDTDSYDNLIEIYEASQKAKELISRLSDLSRKNTAVTMRYLNPNELVQKVVAMVNTSKPNQVTLQTNLRCQEVWLYGNETQMTQLLLNLILNAFHAIGDVAGQVLVTDYADEEHIYFEIEDTGKGIPDEIRGKIFDPFFTTKEKGRGTGLGLAIVMQVVEEHKGTIEVTSQEGKGTTFTVAFPIVVFEDEE